MTKRKAQPIAPAAGDININSAYGGPQMTRRLGGKGRFDPSTRQRFLDSLCLSCNVTMAAAHVGISLPTVYRAKHHDPVFAEQWREALDQGLERLEAQVIEHGGAGVALEPADPDRALDDPATPPPFDFDKAMRALQHFAKQRAGIARKPGRPAATAAETDAAIMGFLDRMRDRAVVERAAPSVLRAPDRAPDGDA